MGDVVAFHRPYKRLGVEKGDEMRVTGVDHKTRTVNLAGKDGETVPWESERLAALEAVGPEDRKATAKTPETGDSGKGPDRGAEALREQERRTEPQMEQARGPKSVERDLSL